MRVGFFSGFAGKTEASPTNRLGMSWHWPEVFTTEVFGSVPMRVVPTQWL